MNIKPSFVLAIVSWGNFFVLSWLMILGKVNRDFTSWAVVVLFLLVALVASAVSQDKQPNVSKPTIRRIDKDESKQP